MKTLLKILLPLVVLGVGVAIAVLMITSREEVETAESVPPPPLVRVMTVQPQDHRFTIETQGNVQPVTSTSLVAQVAGVVESISPNFKDGGFFVDGEVLVQIDKSDYALAVTQARSAIAQAELRIEQEKIQRDIALAEWDTLGEGDPPPLLAREPQLAEANATLEAAKAGLRSAQLNLRRTSVEAPYNGRVRQRMVDIGQYVAPGTPLAQVYSIDVVEVRLPVATKDLAFVNLPVAARDQRPWEELPLVEFRASIGGQTSQWEGRIVRTVGEIDPRTRMLNAVAEIRDPFRMETEGEALKMGLFLNATIYGEQMQGNYIVPRAVMHSPNEILVVTPENTMDIREVTVLRTEDDDVIISKGLNPGERICLSPLNIVTDGMKVRVADESENASASSGPATAAKG